MKRLLGLAPLTCLELAPPAFADCASAAGCDFVGLRLIPATATEPQYPWDDAALARETRRRIAEAGLRVIDVEIFRLTPEVDVAEFEPTLALAQSFGAREALVAGQDPDFDRLADRLADFAERAARYGVRANLEPMPWVAVDRLQAAVDVIARAGRDDVGIVVDALHFDRAGTPTEALAAVPPGRFHYLQLCDAPAQRPADVETMIRQARGERLMPGDGGLDLRGLLAAMPAGVPVSLEIPMAELALTMPAAERVRQMAAKARRLLAEVDGQPLSRP